MKTVDVMLIVGVVAVGGLAAFMLLAGLIVAAVGIAIGSLVAIVTGILMAIVPMFIQLTLRNGGQIDFPWMIFFRNRP